MTQERKDSTLFLIVDTYSTVRPPLRNNQPSERALARMRKVLQIQIYQKSINFKAKLIWQSRGRKFSALTWWKKALIV